ncbi:MAG: glycosyltransferase [Ferruginibacter sp.]
MFFSNINESLKRGPVLVAPLDWGLGHATRCIPIIKELVALGVEVIIGAEGFVKILLQQEFPELQFIDMPGYRISYSKKKNWLPFKLLLQVPRIFSRIYAEQQLLKKLVQQYGIKAVISDNRFGLYHKTIPTVYITHQLTIKTGNPFTEKMARAIHYRFIKKYTHCWVPDFKGEVNVAGELSHPAVLPPNVKYIGCISRFEQDEQAQKKYDLLVLISGPEPQRSLFEQKMLEQLRDFNGRTLLVRGLPGAAEDPAPAGTNLQIKTHLTAAAMNEAMLQSKMVICRSGYTTIMDLIKLRQKAILVPTPGQTEQEYLAGHLEEQQFFYSAAQTNFSLDKALKETASLPFSILLFDMDQYRETVQDFVQVL